MGNCLASGQKDAGGLVVDSSRFSFSRRLDPWDKTGMVAFRNSDLREFPKQVEIVAKKVRVLDATNNKITHVPEYIALMTTCNRLGLSKNRITEIPKSISSLVNLRVLLLDSNRLRTLPRSVFHLPKLERLNLAHNYLTELPRSIRGLKSLKYLDISNNHIEAIPREVGEMTSLEEVHASGNRLTRLPVDFAKLERLRLIIAENNMIDAVPSEILLYCENLQTIGLHGNPITMQIMEETKGYPEFEARRKAKWDKQIAAGVLLGGTSFNETANREKERDHRGITPKGSGKLDSPAPSPKASESELLNKKKKKSSHKKKKKWSEYGESQEVKVDASTL